MAALKREKLARTREKERKRERERVKASALIGLFAKNTQANTRWERERERERNTPTERSVLILARKLRKTKEACRNSVSLDKSANRSSPGESSWPGESSATSESIDSVHVTFQSCIFPVAPFQTLQRVRKEFNNWMLYLNVLLNALYAPQNWNIRNIGTNESIDIPITIDITCELSSVHFRRL